MPIANDDPAGDSLHEQRDQAERGVIHRALVTSGFNRTRAADALGISRVTLYKKMKKYGLMPERTGTGEGEEKRGDGP